MKKYLLLILWIFMSIMVSIILINIYVLSYSETWYYDTLSSDVPHTSIWLVFGAAVWWNSGPSDILKDRLNTAYDAYDVGLIDKILVSGDNGIANYNEPVAMQKYLLEKWVDVHDIYLDYAGFDTYDSLYRAKHIFWVWEVILFTQDFHLKRAMYISKRLWIHTRWITSNRHIYINQQRNNIREILARVKAFLDVEIFRSKSKYLGDPVPILSDADIESAKQEILEK